MTVPNQTIRSVEVLGTRFNVDARHSGGWWNKVTGGTWEPTTFLALESCLVRGQTVIDIGAWIGAITLFAAARGCRVHAFEPDPAALEVLRLNLAANPDLAPLVQLHPVALGTSQGMANLYNNHPGNSGSSLLDYFGYTEEKLQAAFAQVEIVDGARFLESVDLEETCFIKVDIEGAEYDLIPHVGALLHKHKPNLHLSFHPVNLAPTGEGDELLDWMRMRTRAVCEPLADYAQIHYELKNRLRPLDGPLMLRAYRRPWMSGGWLFTQQQVA